MSKGPSRKFTPEQEKEICVYYWTRLPTGYFPSYTEVAQRFECSAPLVKLILRRNSIKARTQAETREGRPCKPINQPVGLAPKCACGCGTPVKWISKDSKWQKYAQGHYHPKRQHHNAEWLKREYIDKVRSVQEIADQCGVNQSAVIKSMKKHGIDRRSTAESLIARGSAAGPNNPAWKGGIAEWEYSPDWKRICKQIKDRDKWTCQHCHERRKRWGTHLHVHHIDGNKLNNHPDNLISLCAKCHTRVHYPPK